MVRQKSRSPMRKFRFFLLLILFPLTFLLVSSCGEKGADTAAGGKSEPLAEQPLQSVQIPPPAPAPLSGTGGTAHRPREGAGAGEDGPAGQFAIATRDPHATDVGLKVLESGGTAADAAFAVGAAISVSEPHLSHALGGGTWALYYNASEDRVRALDGVGTSGSLVELEFFRDPEKNIPFGAHRVIVPGSWDGWMIMLRDEGTMHLDELLVPAIRMAEEGVPSSRNMTGFLLQEEHRIRRYSDTAAVFLPEGRPLQVGDMLIQKNLARTLKGLAGAYRQAHDGLPATAEAEERRVAGIQAARDHYYRGPVARELSRFLLANGGFVTEEDFAAFEAQWLDPLYTWYKDTLVYGSPPNSQGASMLMALNILEQLDLSGGPDDPLTIHRIVEATKLGKIDTWHYVAEPGSMPFHVDQLLSKEYAARRAGHVKDDNVILWPQKGGLELAEENNTTMFALADAYGNGVAVTTSTGAQFLVGGDTGILLNQRMAVMEIAEGNPNIIAPNKKPRHTVNPYMAFRNGRFLLAGGNTGFDTQPQGQIQQFLNMMEFGMSPQEAVARKRFITHAFPASHHPHRAANDLYLEAGTPVHIVEGLRELGHKTGRSAIIGNANVIYRDPSTGVLEYGVDPRGQNRGAVGVFPLDSR